MGGIWALQVPRAVKPQFLLWHWQALRKQSQLRVSSALLCAGQAVTSRQTGADLLAPGLSFAAAEIPGRCTGARAKRNPTCWEDFSSLLPMPSTPEGACWAMEGSGGETECRDDRRGAEMGAKLGQAFPLLTLQTQVRQWVGH